MIIEYELNIEQEVIEKWIKELEYDKYIKYASLKKTNCDGYTYVSVNLDTHAIKKELKGFNDVYVIIEAITEFLSEETHIYDYYTVADCIDSMINSNNSNRYVLSYIASYFEGIAPTHVYNTFLDKVAQYKKYGGNPPLKPEKGLRHEYYLI